jgi:hypothetical protein
VLRRACVLALAFVAAATAGCVATVNDRRFPALDQQRAPIRRIAVAPFAARPEGARESAAVVARQVTEALVDRGVEVVAPEDVGRIVGGVDPATGTPELAALVAREFGAEALLLGEITRWVERGGGAAGTQRPAAVGVHVELHAAPGGELLWEGEFDHTQQPLTENVLITPRYPGGGTRWLTAEEFAQFAAHELAAALPLTP